MTRRPLIRHPVTPLFAGFIVAALMPLLAFATQFQQGDEITATRDEPLYFRDQIFRQAKGGETFSVLAHRADTKKVFVRWTDKGGKQIALSISETAVAAAPLDAAKLQAEAVGAAKARRYADGLQFVERALRSAPAEPVLQQTFQAITQMQTAAQALDQAKADQRQVGVEAARKRKNADTADRPNALNPRDTSGQDRAKQMREDASQTETVAASAVRTAQEAYDATIRGLSALPTISVPGKAPTSDLAMVEQTDGRLPSEKTITPDALPQPATAIVLPMQPLNVEDATRTDGGNVASGHVAGAGLGQIADSEILRRQIHASDEAASPEPPKIGKNPEAPIPDHAGDEVASKKSALFQEGLNALTKSDYDLAITYFTGTIALEPENPAAYFNRGVAYRKKFAFTKAIADYDQALRLDPNYEPASEARAAAYRAKGIFIATGLGGGLVAVALLGLMARRSRLSTRRSRTTSTLLKFECPHCGQRISTDEEQSGTSSFCPTCGGEVTVPAFGPEQSRPEHQTEEYSTNQHPAEATLSTPVKFTFAATVFGRLFSWATERTKMRGRANQAWEVCKQGIEKATVAARLVKKQAHRERLKIIDLTLADYHTGKRAYDTNVTVGPHLALRSQIAEIQHEIDTLRAAPRQTVTSLPDKVKATAGAAVRLVRANLLSLKQRGLLIKLGACLRQDSGDANGFAEIAIARRIAESMRRLDAAIETSLSQTFRWAKHAVLIVTSIAASLLVGVGAHFSPYSNSEHPVTGSWLARFNINQGRSHQSPSNVTIADPHSASAYPKAHDEMRQQSPSFRIPPRYTDAYAFSDGLAVVERGNRKYQQELLEAVGSTDAQREFEAKYRKSIYKVMEERERLKLFSYIDFTGKVVIEGPFNESRRFSEGLAAVRMNKESDFGYIDKNGAQIVPPTFLDAGFFSGGLAAVKQRDGRFGYIDRSGAFVIPARFGVALRFRKAQAWVYTSGEGWSIIDRKGGIVSKKRDQTPPESAYSLDVFESPADKKLVLTKVDDYQVGFVERKDEESESAKGKK